MECYYKRFCCFLLELDKLLAKKSSDPRELQVVEAMEDVCQAKYFSKYHYSPPTTIKACKFLIGEFFQDLHVVCTWWTVFLNSVAVVVCN